MKGRVLNCPNKGKNNAAKCSFYSFPADDDVAKLWVEFCQRQKPFNLNSSVICEKHFISSDYKNLTQINMDDRSYYNNSKAVSLSPNVISIVDNESNNNTYNSGISSSLTSESPILDVIESLPMTDTNDSQLDVETNDDKHLAAQNKRKTLLHTPCPATENEAPLLSGEAAVYRNNPPPMPLPLPPRLGMLPISSRAHTLLSNKAPLPSFEYIAPTNHAPPFNITDFPLMELNRVGVFPAFLHRRSRGEKRPIPDEQKDEKYYERRKRNNEAAKKSRDARKVREDRIAFRAALLEQENSILRAQVMALRDELQTMRQLISTATSASTINSRSAATL